MTTPVLQAVHEYYPTATIDIVADSRSAEIFEYCPYRGELFLKYKKELFRGGWSLLISLRKRYYDLIVDLRTDGFTYLLHGRKKLTKWHRKSPGPHSVEQHMSIISSIYNPVKIPSCHIWLGESERNFANHILGSHKGKRLLGIGPGANSQKKIWSAGSFVSLIDRQGKRFDAVILFGGKRDRQQTEYINTHTSLPCINLCEKTTLLQAAAVQEEIELYIGNDSGLGHMAAAMDKPTMTIFGPGDPERYRPWGRKAMLVVGKDHDISNVTVDDVVNVLEEEYFSSALTRKQE